MVCNKNQKCKFYLLFILFYVYHLLSSIISKRDHSDCILARYFCKIEFNFIFCLFCPWRITEDNVGYEKFVLLLLFILCYLPLCSKLNRLAILQSEFIFCLFYPWRITEDNIGYEKIILCVLSVEDNRR